METLTAPNTTASQAPAKARLSEPTQALLFIAAESPALRGLMGLELPERSGIHILNLRFKPNFPRPWLVPHPRNSDELTFDAEVFHRRRAVCSTGEAHMILWILNVWNPALARSHDWTFDLFRAVQTLDERNRTAIVNWLNDGCPMP